MELRMTRIYKLFCFYNNILTIVFLKEIVNLNYIITTAFCKKIQFKIKYFVY